MQSIGGFVMMNAKDLKGCSAMKLLVIGTLSSDTIAHPGISEVFWANTPAEAANCNAELCLVDEIYAEAFYKTLESDRLTTALFGAEKVPEAAFLGLAHGAVGYLRLPAALEDLAQLLDRMIRHSRDRIRQNMYRNLAEDAFWLGVITRKIPEDENLIAAEAAKYDVKIQGMIQPVFIRYRIANPGWSQQELPEQPTPDMVELIRDRMRGKYFSGFPNVQVLTIAPHKLILLIFTQDLDAPEIRLGCEAFLRDCPSMGIDSLCLMGDPADAINLARHIERLVRAGNDQVYLDNQLLISRQERRQLENPPQPSVKKYLALLDCGMFETAYTELRTYFYTPSVMPKINNSFLMNFRYQLMDGLRDLRVSKKSGINVMQHISEEAANAAADSVQDFLAYFALVFSELSKYSDLSNSQRNITEEVKIHILDHLSQDLSRETIAQRFYLSADYLDRLFRRAYGQTLTDFILHARIDLAKQLLKNDDLFISDVSYKAGFLNASHFTRAFKKATGLTPSDFRKQVKAATTAQDAGSNA